MVKLTQGRNTASFILSEGNGQISRAGGVIVDPATIRPGMIMKKVAATTDVVEHWVPITAAGEGDGIAIYGVVTDSGSNSSIAILVRDAEVNGNQLEWPTGFSDADKVTNMARLATLGLIVRN